MTTTKDHLADTINRLQSVHENWDEITRLQSPPDSLKRSIKELDDKAMAIRQKFGFQVYYTTADTSHQSSLNFIGGVLDALSAYAAGTDGIRSQVESLEHRRDELIVLFDNIKPLLKVEEVNKRESEMVIPGVL